MKEPGYMKATEEHKELCTLIAMEECSELIQAISKAKRGKMNKANLTEEMADVFICLHWLQKIYDISRADISEWMNIKEKRIIDRIENSEFK